jgi:hypothetical protein
VRLSRTFPWTLAALAASLLATPSPVSSHLSIIRQGHECAGANEAGDRTGDALAAGDFNGDGYEDLAIGVPHEAVGTAQDAGAVVILWGSDLGITHEGSVILTADDMNGVVEAGALVGFALAAGDFNADGYDDLAVGAPGTDAFGLVDSGEIFVLRGTDTGLWVWFVFDENAFGGAVEAGDAFGHALATGHFAGTAYTDLAIGAPGEDGGVGAVFFTLGNVVGPVGGSGWFKPSTLGYSDFESRFGHALAAGNLLGSGEEDLAVGAPTRDTYYGADSGEIFLIPGSPSGLTATGNVAYAAYHLDTSQAGALFGWALAAGHLYAGSYDALAMGEPLRDLAVPDGGRVLVAPGGPAGLQADQLQILTQESGGASTEGGDRFGYSLAAGYYWDPSDGYEDLAVGSPGDGFGFGSGAGLVQVFPGKADGPDGSTGWSTFSQGVLGETVEDGDALGWAVVLGRFDRSGYGNLAVSAPGEDAAAGLVHVIAPWRQALGISCETSIALDCEGRIVFSQKPFDEVWIASTTKIMTILLATEHAQLPPEDPGYVDLDALWTVPAWVADDVPGSQVPLESGERMSLLDLMYACLLRSGNDAAFLIAQIVGGNGPSYGGLSSFVEEMNQRAQELGMTRTEFHNPAGLDFPPVAPESFPGEHHSTAEDMAKLSRFAMQNPLFAQIAGTLSRDLLRYPAGSDTAWVWTCENIYAGVLSANAEEMVGIKGGATPNAQATGCFAARDPGTGGIAIAGTYHTPLSVSDQTGLPDAIGIIRTGLAECGGLLPGPGQWRFHLPIWFDGLSSAGGCVAGGGAEWISERDADAMEFNLFREEWNGEAATLQFVARRISQTHFESGEEVSFGIAPFGGHDTLRITNMGDTTAYAHVTLPYGTPQTHALAPNETLLLDPYPVPEPWADFTWSIQNRSPWGLAMELCVEEPYVFEVSVAADPAPGPHFSAVVTRDGLVVEDGFAFRTTGRDAEAGSAFRLLAHAAGLPVSALSPPRVPSPEGGELDLLGAAPNPFRGGTRIRFRLRRAGRLRLAIYDASGRRIHRSASRWLDAGVWSVGWDGRSDAGRRLGQGTYFYRLFLDGRARAEGKALLLR